MSVSLTLDFPLVEAAYTDEFGRVDPEVCALARDVWRSCGHALAEELLHDSARGMQLMLKAVANVTSVLEDDATHIRSKKAYLYRAYKNLLLAEIERESNHSRILDRLPQYNITTSFDGSETELNHRILIAEIRLRMGEWTRAVFDLHQLGYGFEELVPKYGSAANAIRSRYSKDIARLARKLNAEIHQIDRRL